MEGGFDVQGNDVCVRVVICERAQKLCEIAGPVRRAYSILPVVGKVGDILLFCHHERLGG